MASHRTDDKDERLETSPTAPTSPPSPSVTATSDLSAPSSKYGGRRWVNPGPPPRLEDLPEERIKIAASCARISDADYPQWRLDFKKRLAEQDARSPPPLGMKPDRGGSGVFRINIPDTTLLIRLWDGGAEQMGQYLLDYYDYEENTPINTPKGWNVFPVIRRGTVPYGGINGQMTSIEQAFGYRRDTIPFGTEKFIALEGSRWRLQRPGVEKDLLFAVPYRPTPEEYGSFQAFDEV